MSLSSHMTDVLMRQGEETQRQREDSHVQTEAVIGFMLPQTKERLGEARKDFPSETLNRT